MNNRWRQVRRVRRIVARRQIRKALEQIPMEYKKSIEEVRKVAYRTDFAAGTLIDYLLIGTYGEDEE